MKVLTTSDPNLIKIRVQDIMYDDGWHYKNIIELRPSSSNISLFCNNRCLTKWTLREQIIPQLPVIRLKDGTIKHRSPPIVFYVIGQNDGKAYRYLYFKHLSETNQFMIGTRTDIGARFPTNCRSRWQRTKSSDAQVRKIIKERRKKRQERRVLKKMKKMLNSS